MELNVQSSLLICSWSEYCTLFIHTLTLEVVEMVLTKEKNKVHYITDHFGAMIHSEMDDRWHNRALTVIILVHPLSSNYLWEEQKPGAWQLLLTWQLHEQQSQLYYEANLQSSRNKTQSTEGKCLDRSTQTTVKQIEAAPPLTCQHEVRGLILEQRSMGGQCGKDDD